MKNERGLLPLKELKQVNVPFYDELAIKHIYPLVKNDSKVMRYFPSKLPEGRLPDRDYFWNVLNTVNEPYVSQLIKHANELRMTASKEKEAQEVIQVTDEWWDKLNQVPFMSCKSIIHV